MNKITEELKPCVDKNILDLIPFCVSVKDIENNIIYANRAFETKFGHWKEKKCHQIIRTNDSACEGCDNNSLFKNKLHT